jgi:hypothetical protein
MRAIAAGGALTFSRAGVGRRPRPSADHAIGADEHRPRDRHAERLRRLQVDDELELRGLLDGKLCGPGALQDLVDESR